MAETNRATCENYFAFPMPGKVVNASSHSQLWVKDLMSLCDRVCGKVRLLKYCVSVFLFKLSQGLFAN